jgi:hypothetical protein
VHKSDASYLLFAHTSIKLREQFTFGTTFDLVWIYFLYCKCSYFDPHTSTPVQKTKGPGAFLADVHGFTPA